MRTLLITVVLVCICLPAFAQDFDERADVMTLPEARSILGQSIPNVQNWKKLNNFFRERHIASKVLDDLALEEEVLRDWVKSVGSHASYNKLGYFLIYNSDRVNEGIEILNSQLQKLQTEDRLTGYVIQASKLIELYSSLRLNDEVARLVQLVETQLESAERQLQSEQHAYSLANAKARFYRARAGHYWRSAKYDEAIIEIKDSIRSFESLKALGGGLTPQTERYADEGEHRKALIRLANIYISQHQFYQAELVLREAYGLVRGKRGINGIRRSVARLKSEQGDYQAAYDVLKENLN